MRVELLTRERNVADDLRRNQEATRRWQTRTMYEPLHCKERAATWLHSTNDKSATVSNTIKVKVLLITQLVTGSAV